MKIIKPQSQNIALTKFHDARRNFAESLLNRALKRPKNPQPLVDSNEAEVIDYYHFASYLTEIKFEMNIEEKL